MGPKFLILMAIGLLLGSSQIALAQTSTPTGRRGMRCSRRARFEESPALLVMRPVMRCSRREASGGNRALLVMRLGIRPAQAAPAHPAALASRVGCASQDAISNRRASASLARSRNSLAFFWCAAFGRYWHIASNRWQLSISVAFAAKRTFSEPRLQGSMSTRLNHAAALPTGLNCCARASSSVRSIK
jgi:hypothetical protein